MSTCTPTCRPCRALPLHAGAVDRLVQGARLRGTGCASRSTTRRLRREPAAPKYRPATGVPRPTCRVAAAAHARSLAASTTRSSTATTASTLCATRTGRRRSAGGQRLADRRVAREGLAAAGLDGRSRPRPAAMIDEIRRVGDHPGFVQVLLPVRNDAPRGASACSTRCSRRSPTTTWSPGSTTAARPTGPPSSTGHELVVRRGVRRRVAVVRRPGHQPGQRGRVPSSARPADVGLRGRLPVAADVGVADEQGVEGAAPRGAMARPSRRSTSSAALPVLDRADRRWRLARDAGQVGRVARRRTTY